MQAALSRFQSVRLAMKVDKQIRVSLPTRQRCSAAAICMLNVLHNLRNKHMDITVAQFKRCYSYERDGYSCSRLPPLDPASGLVPNPAWLLHSWRQLQCKLRQVVRGQLRPAARQQWLKLQGGTWKSAICRHTCSPVLMDKPGASSKHFRG
jgi:hypothetical protein